MKDLDFDELDKAVNSLMSGVAKDAPAKSDTNDDPVIELKPQGDMNKTPESFSTPVSTPPNTQRQSQSSAPAPSADSIEPKDDQQSSSVPVVSDAPTANADAAVATPTVEPPVRSTAASLVSDDSLHESDSSNGDITSETTPETTTAQTGSEPSKNTPMTVPSSLPARRAGRFMDMVHPSADMKRPEVTAKPSRSGVTIAPRDSFSPANTPAEPSESVPAKEHISESSEDSLEQPVSPVAALTGIDANPVVKKTEETSAPAVSHESPKSEWPDPLDMAGFEEDKLDQSLKDVTKGDKPANTPLFGSEPTDTLKPKKDEEISASAPLTSPFLPDTKVEKRPLGGGLSADEPDHTPIHPSSSDEQSYGKSDPEAQLPPSNDAADAPLPAELHSDLIAIEADKGPADQVAAQPEPSSSSNSPAAPAIKRSEPSVSTQASSSVNTVKSTDTASGKAAPALTGPTSIPKQYREEQSTSDEDNGSIYDTDSYHQPLDHPPKKKSGWMWIVWILLILVAGAAGGAGIYFMGML